MRKWDGEADEEKERGNKMGLKHETISSPRGKSISLYLSVSFPSFIPSHVKSGPYTK